MFWTSVWLSTTFWWFFLEGGGNHLKPCTSAFPQFFKVTYCSNYYTLPVDWTYDFPKHVDLLGSIVVHDNVRNNLHKIVRDDCKDKKLMLFSSPQCGCLLVYNVLLHWLLKRKFCVLNKEHRPQLQSSSSYSIRVMMQLSYIQPKLFFQLCTF